MVPAREGVALVAVLEPVAQGVEPVAQLGGSIGASGAGGSIGASGAGGSIGSGRAGSGGVNAIGVNFVLRLSLLQKSGSHIVLNGLLI